MSVVSNLFRGSDRRPDPAPVLCRPARREEVHTALRVLLGHDGKLADGAQVLDFLRFAVQRRIDVSALWIAEQHGKLVWATLPVVSPGRTMLLFLPTGDIDPTAAATRLIDRVCDHYSDADVHLAQALVEPSDRSLLQIFDAARFDRMAELVYMQRLIRLGMANFVLPEPLNTVTYSEQTRALFAQTILRTYEKSLDCPRLNGLRDIDDVLAGHRATGDFDPDMWHVLRSGEHAIGVMLVSRLRHADTAELVYFGLIPEARARGIAVAAMEHAFGIVAKAELSQLSLAVDSINVPAIKLYTRHGFTRVGSKVALIRDLRRIGHATPAAPAQPTASHVSVR